MPSKHGKLFRSGFIERLRDWNDEGEIMFHVHFDGADGKCQVQRLKIEHCIMLSEWRQKIIE